MSRLKIGFHTGIGGNRQGIGQDYWQRLDAAGLPVMQMGADEYGPCHEVANLRRASGVPHVIAYRVTTKGQNDGFDYDVPDYNSAPDAAAKIQWEAITAKLPPEFDKDLCWLVVLNEVDHERSDWLGWFGEEIGKLALANGYKVALFGFSSGEPEPLDWSTSGMLTFLCLAEDHPDQIAVALHEYSYDLSDIWSGFPWKLGRFIHLNDTCDYNGIMRPNILITEWGWDQNDVPAVDLAMQHIQEANDDLYNNYDNILGVALWYLGGGFSDIAKDAQKFIQPVGNLGVTYPGDDDGGGNGNGRTEPDVIRHEIHILPQDTTLEELRAITAKFHPNRNFFGFSHDGVEAVMYWSKPTGTIHIWEGDRWNFDLDERFAWLGVNIIHHDFSEVMPSGFKYLVWPTDYTVVRQQWGMNPQNYAQFGLPGHDGIDIHAPEGTPIRAVADGVVVRAEENPSVSNYGVHVRLMHDPYNEMTIYAHMVDGGLAVSLGQEVTAGQILGLADATGNATGSHCHFGRKRPGESYTDEHGTWPYNLFDPTPLLKPLAPALFPPPVKPPTGTAHDLVPYFVSSQPRGVLYEVQTEGAGQQRHQTQMEDNGVFYFTKDQEWEQLRYDDHTIWRGIDTSPGGGLYYRLRDGDLDWSKWCARYMRVGEMYQRQPLVTFYRKSDCVQVSQATQVSLIVLQAVYQSYTFFTGITLDKVIEMWWTTLDGTLVEKYFYSVGMGLVGWEGAGKQAAVSEIHSPGARPDNIRESGCYG